MSSSTTIGGRPNDSYGRYLYFSPDEIEAAARRPVTARPETSPRKETEMEKIGWATTIVVGALALAKWWWVSGRYRTSRYLKMRRM